MSNQEIFKTDQEVWNSQCLHSVLKIQVDFLDKAFFYDPTATQYGRPQKVMDEMSFVLEHVSDWLYVDELIRPEKDANSHQWFEEAVIEAIEEWAADSDQPFESLHSLMCEADIDEYVVQEKCLLCKMKTKATTWVKKVSNDDLQHIGLAHEQI